MSHVDKSRAMRREEHAPSVPGAARSSPASPRAPASRLLSSGDAAALAQWSAAIIAAAAALQLSRGTSFHQLAIGVLGSLICTFVGLSLVEIAWRIVTAAWPHRHRADAAARPPDGRVNDDR